MFKERKKIRKNNWVDFSGGEPTMLKDFDKILTFFDKINFGTIVVYSNAVNYSQKIYDLLKKNKIILTTSLDTGISSNYYKIRGKDAFPLVVNNLLKYRKSGTKNLWLKYVVTENNKTKDDMWSFILAMLAIKPNKIMLCPDFPYGDEEIPQSTVEFVAELFCLIKKYLNIIPVDYTAAMGDSKFVEYRQKLKIAIEKYEKQNPYDKNFILLINEKLDNLKRNKYVIELVKKFPIFLSIYKKIERML